MSECKWTPGPWVVDHITIRSPSTRTSIACTLNVAWPHGNKPRDEYANAHLIAAAPELYDLLLELDAFCETGYENGNQCDYVGSELMRKVLSVLAKARGETK